VVSNPIVNLLCMGGCELRERKSPKVPICDEALFVASADEVLLSVWGVGVDQKKSREELRARTEKLI